MCTSGESAVGKSSLVLRFVWTRISQVSSAITNRAAMVDCRCGTSIQISGASDCKGGDPVVADLATHP